MVSLHSRVTRWSPRQKNHQRPVATAAGRVGRRSCASWMPSVCPSSACRGGTESIRAPPPLPRVALSFSTELKPATCFLHPTTHVFVCTHRDIGTFYLPRESRQRHRPRRARRCQDARIGSFSNSMISSVAP